MYIVRMCERSALPPNTYILTPRGTAPYTCTNGWCVLLFVPAKPSASTTHLMYTYPCIIIILYYSRVKTNKSLSMIIVRFTPCHIQRLSENVGPSNRVHILPRRHRAVFGGVRIRRTSLYIIQS